MPWWRIWRRSSLNRRPGGRTRRGPYPAGPRLGRMADAFLNNSSRWLWIPAPRRDDHDLRPKTLWRAGDRDAAGRCHAHHREAALVGAVGAEPKQAIDAGKARRVDQHLG